jgi:hypothetical protein
MAALNGAAVVVASFAAVAALAWLGFQVPARPLRPPRRSAAPVEEVSLPGDLPAPVARYYRMVGGSETTAVRVDTFTLWGRARMRRAGLPRMPVTFWSEHRVGWSGRQLLAITWYRMPILRGHDTSIDGHGEMHIGRQRLAGPEIDQGENLFLWAELVLLPSVLATRPGARWVAIDEQSARLRFPFGGGEDEMTFRFDPESGLLTEGRALRYKAAGTPKIGWRIRYQRWSRFDAGVFPTRIDVTWEDDGRPWFVLDVDGVAVNASISDLLTAGTSASDV